MIKGTGIDIIEISRIEKNIQNQAFLDKVYTKNEQEYILSRGNSAQTAAGVFAAKEAVSKALGTGISSFTDLEVMHTKAGQPYMEYNGYNIMLSISHCKEYAVANAIVMESE